MHGVIFLIIRRQGVKIAVFVSEIAGRVIDTYGSVDIYSYRMHDVYDRNIFGIIRFDYLRGV